MAEPLVLLPGLMCDETIWAPQLIAVSSSRLVMVAAYGAAASLPAMARAALDQAPERFALAGHSMGGRVALEIMAIAPQRVTRLALFDTGTHAARDDERQQRMALIALGRQQGMAALAARWLPPMLAPCTDPAGPVMQSLAAMVMRAGLASCERQIGALLARRDAAPLLAGVGCKLLLGVGSLDRWSPPAQHEAMAILAPQARLVIWPGAGHMAPIEAPNAVTAALQDWLA